MKSSAIFATSIAILVLIVGGVFLFLRPKEEVNLPIVVEQYFDYNCVFCRDFHSVWKTLESTYADSPDVEFKAIMNPILGSSSLNASFAAEAAKKQDKLDEFSDIMFENFDKRDDQSIISFAEELKLDIAKFNADRESTELQADVLKVLEENKAKGINSTPAVFVNNRRVAKLDLQTIKNQIDSKIKIAKENEKS